MCFVFVYKCFSEIFVLIIRTKRDIVTKVYRYLCQILINLEYRREIFLKTYKYQISLKYIWREQSCFMRTDRRTDMTKLVVNFMVSVLLRSVDNTKGVCLYETHTLFSKIYERAHKVAGKHKLLYNINVT
jgi:hypothetical protein